MIRFVLNESCYEAAIVERMSHSIDCLPLPPPLAPALAGERLLMAAETYGGRRRGRPLPGSWQHADMTLTPSAAGLCHNGERKAKRRGDTTQLHLVIYSHIVNIEIRSLQTRQASMLGAMKLLQNICMCIQARKFVIHCVITVKEIFFRKAFPWVKFKNIISWKMSGAKS